MPLPVARCYDIVFVRVMRGIRVGVYFARQDIIMLIGRRVGMVECCCLCWAWLWRGCGIFNISARAVDWVPH